MAHDPPQPPPFQRRILIARVQGIGVGVLCLVVIAALSGLLGLRTGEANASGAGLEVHVKYPRILRYKTSLPLEISIRNAGAQALQNVEVQIGRSYLDNFHDVQVTPDTREITERDYRVVLDRLPAGDTREVVAWLEANRSGQLDASLRVVNGTAPALDMRWTTTVLP
ncbi:hypothetical protein [Piscinibacter sp. XHJ-5]|uniref:hypothetical protein n=1 Tax=Piscinibacter sp. XHJ-5 TaxID=3037797 RepID=UPI002452B3AE|nr:hypothetical protein [Piscinibacter sp. XHJ-5]